MCVFCYLLYLNYGQPSPKFKPNRGIRQGDPPSPYLFILCADVFSRMITSKQDQSLINGISIAQNAPKVSHQFLHMTA
jgi:hypothetical protein